CPPLGSVCCGAALHGQIILPEISLKPVRTPTAQTPASHAHRYRRSFDSLGCGRGRWATRYTTEGTTSLLTNICFWATVTHIENSPDFVCFQCLDPKGFWAKARCRD